jgi:adenosylmethionine-8-amino-7-oxononanoate aminotransferase
MGWCVGSFGWGNENITNALKNYRGPEYVYGSFLYKPWVELGDLLAELTSSKKLVKSFRTTGGSGAVETAMKIALLYTGRTQFLSVQGCYHGNGFGALSIGDAANVKTYHNLLSGCHKINVPLDAKAAKKAETILKTKKIAAFILEPVNTHPQIHVPSQEFIDIIKKACKKYGTLLVADEVAVGFGRTGKTFACELFDLQPDILCLAKAISGGSAPLGATITSEAIAKSVQEKIHAFPTYGWHPRSVQASIASIQYFIHNKEVILRNVSELNALFVQRLSNMKFKKPAKVSAAGLAISVDTGSNSYAERIAKKCLSSGLLIETNESNLMMFPSLVMNQYTAEQGLQILEDNL